MTLSSTLIQCLCKVILQEEDTQS